MLNRKLYLLALFNFNICESADTLAILKKKPYKKEQTLIIHQLVSILFTGELIKRK